MEQSGSQSGMPGGGRSYAKPAAFAVLLLVALGVVYKICTRRPVTVVEPNPITFSTEVPSNELLRSSDPLGRDISAIASRKLGLVADQLTDVRIRKFGGRKVFTFGVAIDGIPLADARVVARVDEATNVVSTIAGYNVATGGANGHEASVSADEAIALALRRSSAVTGRPEKRFTHTTPTLILVPGSSASDPARLCWDITVSLIDGALHHSYRYFLTATPPLLLLRESDQVQSARDGKITSVRWLRTPLDATQSFGVPRALVRHSGNKSVPAD